jgi:hypothetical protein
MYRIIGADGKEYGPISAEQLRQWITEGRVNAQTRVLAEGATEWKTVAETPEFAAAAPSPRPLPPPPTMTPLPSATAGMRSAASVTALDQVNGPGVGLIITGAINILMSLGMLAMSIANIGVSALQGSSAEAERFLRNTSGTVNFLFFGVSFLLGILILFGGIKLRKLESYGFCIAASILAMIPCLSCCFPLGIVIGIWALVVMSKPEVKDFFH